MKDTTCRVSCWLSASTGRSPTIGKEIRDWVELHGTWYKIEYFVSDKVDVRISEKPTVKIKAKKEGEETNIL